ncbi:MAG: Response regulator [Candidatus Magnetoglobus multicellularis str. Araruama]|uniref:Response regulator n=1 Tax=Candidatus Magnetoglobus multicellularis str. Araruama TaxID=890399 RepID=A0A1V1PDX7_9BACT|nr:MAG: Response regulator [Candidatus Magnetoglobus multicellularis str. Araruama]
MTKKVILCVDDEKFVLDTLRTQIVNHYGAKYECEISESAQEAMELIDELQMEEQLVIILVSDWLMPGIKGDEFLINVHQRYPNIVKIMLTGQADAHAINRTMKGAALHKCLQKPWREEDLIKTIESGIKNEK